MALLVNMYYAKAFAKLAAAYMYVPVGIEGRMCEIN